MISNKCTPEARARDNAQYVTMYCRNISAVTRSKVGKTRIAQDGRLLVVLSSCLGGIEVRYLINLPP